MAYIRKRGSTWSFTVDTGKDHTGKRTQKSLSGFKTKKEAQLAAGKIEDEVAAGTYVEEQDTTFGDFIKEWRQIYFDDAGVKESTLRVRTHESNCLISKLGKDTKIKDITPKMYQKALSDLKKDGYSENTLSGIHGTGKMIFRKAIEFRTIKTDPTQYAKVPKAVKSVEELEASSEVPKYLEKDELAKLLLTAREKGMDSLDYTIFLTLAYTGMRIGELCALKWTDIDFDEHTISITKTYYNPQNNILKYKLLTPKTESSIRIIDVDKIVTDELDKHRSKQNIVLMKHRKIYHDKKFVFGKTDNKYGYPIYQKFIESRMARLLKLSGLPEELTPHSLRHTHTSLLAEAGASLEEIMERLGHCDDDTTRKVYLHVTKPKKKEAAQKFSKLMSNLL